MAEGDRTAFRPERVIKLALGAAGRHLPIFVALPILFLGVPLFLTFMAIGLASWIDGSGMLILLWAVIVAGGALVQASLARATLLYAEGRRATFDTVFMAGVAIAPRLIALAWLVAFGTLVGTLLLVLPGVILFLMWSVAVPLMVADGGGIGATLERSRRLTSGRRWWIFGLYTALVVTLCVVAALAQAAAAVAVGWAGAAYVTAAAFALPPLLFVIVSGTLAAAIYAELRRAHDHGDVDQLAEVFA